MQFRNKYHFMRVTQFVAVLGALFGLSKIVTGEMVLGGMLLFGAAAVGLVASILAKYYEARQDNTTASQEIALDTLARLSEQRAKDKRQKL